MKTLKIVISITIIALFINCIITGIAENLFLIRMEVEHDLNVENKDQIISLYHNIYDNEKLSNFINKYFSNKKMIRTFPNLKIQDQDGNIIYMDSLLPDIQPSYIKVHDKKGLI